MRISWQSVKETFEEAVIVYIGVFLTITLYGLYVGEIDLFKNAIATLIICLVLEMLT